MLGWIKSLFARRPSQSELVRARMMGAAEQAIRARYDNAQTTDENQRAWWLADYLSAKSANNYQVRRQLRNRSRYEVSNNPYLFGVTNGHADDVLGDKGPTLKCRLPKEADNRQVEQRWREWAEEVGLVEKLRTAVLAELVDGEGILVLKTVREMESPVKLYPADVEADQVTTPAPKDLQELWVDGLVLHPVTGRPVAYDILKHHPGDYFFPNLSPLAVERVPARHVVHTFPKFRPGQVRGVPVFTPSLDLFSELRSFRKAVLSKAQLSANLTAVGESEAPADPDGTETPRPFSNVPIDRGTLSFLPAGYTLKPYPSGDCSTTYEMFQEKCLGEAVRPLAYPLNLALGTSQKFNFSSARLDHVNYRNSLDVKRARYDRDALDRVFAAWVAEGSLVPGYLPAGVRSAADIPHEWHWPGYQPLDPVQDAAADHARLSGGTSTYREFWAARGRDWREVLAQQACEKAEIERLGLVFGEPLKKSDTLREEVDDTGDAAEAAAAARQAELLAALRQVQTSAPPDPEESWSATDYRPAIEALARR
jgi:lambda family phage portal protein